MSHGKSKPLVRRESGLSSKLHTTAKGDYFSLLRKHGPAGVNTAKRIASAPQPQPKPPVALNIGNIGNRAKEVDNTGDASATTPGETASSSSSSVPASRKSSLCSVSFRPPMNPSLPQGLKKPHGGNRIREASSASSLAEPQSRGGRQCSPLSPRPSRMTLDGLGSVSCSRARFAKDSAQRPASHCSPTRLSPPPKGLMRPMIAPVPIECPGCRFPVLGLAMTATRQPSSTG
ncbi:hypothetical protein F4777DRAFT_57494 [Nemania sp. FL0916]|nr:hypothetical protein F4777DRAFT_57494 [Nemania sp. FL0916]